MGNQQLNNYKNMKEVWKDIKNFEGYYKISNKGRVLSITRKVKSSRSKSGYRTVNQRILKTRIDKYGYNTVILRKHNTDKHFTIHRLVAEAFIDNPNNYPSINHIDENKLNNTPENLERCTIKYNNLYNNRQQSINEKLKEVVKGKVILQYDLDMNFIKEWKSLREIHRTLRLNRQEINKTCRKERGSYANYIWKYK